MSGRSGGVRAPFSHPHDTSVSGGLRFAVEVIAWIAAPWTAAEESWWLAVPVLVVLVALPAIFSTPGDKRQVVVATPGPVRIGIEVLLHAVAIAGAWLAWPVWGAVVATVIVVAAILTGIPRLLWLWRGAVS